MTTTAERAKAVVIEIIDGLLREGAVTAGVGERWTALITQALHQAQNDKLEEAAQVSAKRALFASDLAYKNACHEIASSIRSLKSKD